jgi:hypothetical protein
MQYLYSCVSGQGKNKHLFDTAKLDDVISESGVNGKPATINFTIVVIYHLFAGYLQLYT